jgi:hypothetical protein
LVVSLLAGGPGDAFIHIKHVEITSDAPQFEGSTIDVGKPTTTAEITELLKRNDDSLVKNNDDDEEPPTLDDPAPDELPTETKPAA